MYMRNNIPAGETRDVVATFIVRGGVDSAVAYKHMPAELINEMDNLLVRMMEYTGSMGKEEHQNAR